MAKKIHLLREPNSPAICGAGNGRKLFSRVQGVSFAEIAKDGEALKKITCKTCDARVSLWAFAWERMRKATS